MFDDRLYKRGALTLHALRTDLGDAPFFELLRTWTARYRHGTVSTEEFVVCAEVVSGARWRRCCTRGCTSGPARAGGPG